MNFARLSALHPAITPSQTASLLQELFPARRVIIVGVTRDNLQLLKWPENIANNILLIDGRPEALADIRQRLPETSLWGMRDAILAETAAETYFYCASNAGEDGLVPPEKLGRFWPNLRTIEKRTCTIQTLENILVEPELLERACDGTWLIVNCLPALRIVEGAGSLLLQCKVLWLRVTLEALDGEPGTTLQETTEYLAAHFFRCVYFLEENHPHVGQAIFVRDESAKNEQELVKAQATSNSQEAENKKLRAQCNLLHQENTELVNSNSMLNLQKTEITVAFDKQENLANERKIEIEALNQETAKLLADRDKLTDQCDKQTKVLNELRIKLENLNIEHNKLIALHNILVKKEADLTAALNEKSELANAKYIELQNLEKEKLEIVTKQTRHIEVLTAQSQYESTAFAAILNSHAQQTAKHDETLHQRDAELQESLARLSLMQEELLKAEAQIELIKEFLLREPVEF